MTLVTYDPKHFLNDFFNTDSFLPTGVKDSAYKHPVGDVKVNISEDEHGFHLSAVVPGWKEDEVHLEINNNVLTIRGEHKENQEENTPEYKVREFMRQSFERSFRLGDHIDQDKVAAKMEAGILNVDLPKKEEAKPKTRKVPIS